MNEIIKENYFIQLKIDEFILLCVIITLMYGAFKLINWGSKL